VSRPEESVHACVETFSRKWSLQTVVIAWKRVLPCESSSLLFYTPREETEYREGERERERER